MSDKQLSILSRLQSESFLNWKMEDTHDSGYDSQAAEANELQLAIHDRNADLVIRAITTLRRPHAKGHALWSVVGSLFGIGSTSAIRLCRKHGFDPDMRVKRRIDL